MALQPCEEVNNIHEGKLYNKTFSRTAGDNAITWRGHLLWLAQQINNFLNALPDGYVFEFVGIMGRYIVNAPLLLTDGTSHAQQHRFWYRNMSDSTSGIADYYYLADPADFNLCHYKSINYPLSGSGSVDVTSYDTTQCIAPGASRSDTIYYRLWISDNGQPTE